MQLHGIIVEGREVLHDQFSLKEVWQAVEPFSAPYREMLSHLKKTEVELLIEVLLNFLEGKESPAGRSEARRFLEKELPAGQAAASWLQEAGYGTFVEKNKEKRKELIPGDFSNYSLKDCQFGFSFAKHGANRFL